MNVLKKYWIILLLVILVCVGVYLIVKTATDDASNPVMSEETAEPNAIETERKLIQNHAHYDEYESVLNLKNNSRTDSVLSVRELIDRFLKINQGLEVDPGYHAAIIKMKMVESSLNLIADSISESGSTEDIAEYCLMIRDVKPMLVDKKYFQYVLLKELGFDAQSIPMSASASKYNSVVKWDGKKIIKSAAFEVKLEELSQANGIPSLHDVLSGKAEGFEMPKNMDQYYSNKAYMQYISMPGVYEHWKWLKAYCEYKKLSDIVDEDERYNRFVESYVADPWVTEYSYYLSSYAKDKLKIWFSEGPFTRLEGFTPIEMSE